jgi:protein TonB
MRKIVTVATLFCTILLTTAATAQAPKDEVLVRTSVDTTTEKNSEKLVFTKVDVEAKVDMQQWRLHLESNLMGPIEKAAKKGMKPGTYTVNVRFLVEKDGSISDVRALNDPGYGLAAASEKVVRTGPKWIAGEQNGRKVRSYHTQPMTFVISEK